MNERFAHVDEAISRAFPDGQTAILGPDGTCVLLLNEMGGIVWALCDGTRTCADIAAFIHQNTHGAERSRIEEDVHTLLLRLRDAGLVVDRAPCPA